MVCSARLRSPPMPGSTCRAPLLCAALVPLSGRQVHRVQQGLAASAERLSGANTCARIVAIIVPTGFRKQSAAEFLVVVTPESGVLTVVKPCTRVGRMMQQ